MKGDPIRVLLVEDNREDALLLQRTLAHAGRGTFHLTQVERLDGALRLLREEAFDVVLLDLGLSERAPSLVPELGCTERSPFPCPSEESR